MRDKLLAYTFGASHTLDIYYYAFRIPDLIFASIASIVSASVLIPFFLEKMNESTHEGKKFIDNVFSAFFLVIIVVSVVVFFYVEPLIKILLPGFSNNSSFGELVTATRILLLSPIFFGISNFFSSITQMYRRFLVYALSPFVYNLGIIVGIIFFYPLFGLYGLISGVVLGAFLHMTIQIIFVYKHGIFPKFRFNIDWLSIRNVFLTSLPRTLALSSNELASFFLIALASLMASGSVSVLSLAVNLQAVPLTIIGVSYSSAIFPTLSKLFVSKERDVFLMKMIESAKHIIFWSIPITVLFIVLRAQIVRVIYGAGEFDWADTRLTAAVLALFIISVVGQSLILLFIRTYYAQGKTLKPLIINISSSIVIIILGYSLTKAFYASPLFAFFLENLLKVSDQPGTSVLVLPLAYSLGVLLSTCLLWYVFERDHRGFSRPVMTALFQSLASSIIMGYVTFVSLRFFNIFFTLEKSWGVFLQGFCAGIVGIISGIIVLVLLKNKEIKEVWATLHHKIWKAKIIVPNQETL